MFGVGVWLALTGVACLPPADTGLEMLPELPVAEEDVQALAPAALSAENAAGTNLGGVNLGGANLGGANLGGANLGGVNLGGANLGGANLGGSNLGGNNLGGNNLGGSNLGGVNLGGSNLGGVNLGGSNLGGSNLGGSNVAGTNLAGNAIAGTSLGSGTLAGTTSGKNIHNLASTSSTTTMLYSMEDLWSAKTARCVVMGIGSTAFPKLLGQQSANAKISVALGKLPWGFASSSGGPIALQAWEAIVWGDRTYCVFVMAAPPSTTWPGMAGFIKAVFRWNAGPSQIMEVSGIEASAPHDPTLSTAVAVYPGMMNAAPVWRAGRISETTFVAGELAFITATTNNQSVMVDFSSWVLGVDDNAIVLGNPQSINPPTYAEALYMALNNEDGTISVALDDAAAHTSVMPAGMVNSIVELNAAYLDWQGGRANKPVPRRCGGAMFLNTWYGEPVPAGKCDSGLDWSPGFCTRAAVPWSTVPGTTAPMNSYMQLAAEGVDYRRGAIVNDACGTLKEVLSETYVHMWEKSFDVPGTPVACVAETSAAFCKRLGRNCGAVTATDNCGQTRTVSTCGSCGSGLTCGGGGITGICGSGVALYEAEAPGNVMVGATRTLTCAKAQMKFGGSTTSGGPRGACTGGNKIGFIGKTSSNYVTINNVNVTTAGTYNMTVFGVSGEERTFYISVNGGSAKTLKLFGPDWHRSTASTTTVSLKAGNNSIKFYNNSVYAPDLDRIMISGTSVPPPAPPPVATNCAFAITQNVYAYSSWWGTVTFKNNGSTTVTGLKAEFDVPAGVSCTADAVPSGATLSPLTGSGTSARTTSNHCIFKWSSASLAPGASRTFNYSTNSQSFNAATKVTAGSLTCL